MTFEVHEHEVLQVEEVQTSSQIALIKSHHDMLYHSVLEHDTVNDKVIAKIYDYQNNLQTVPTPYTETIIFEYEGEQIEVTTKADGTAEIDFVTEVPGQHIVKTVNPKIRNGEVAIDA